MSSAELRLRAQGRLRQFTDRGRPWEAARLELRATGFPHLPAPETAPTDLREALGSDAAKILAGRWTAFGHLELNVDDPPKWQYDYLANRDVETTLPGARLNHRELPDGADIKLIWELSRWQQLVRLAMASHVLADSTAGRKCLEWLENWVLRNPPYRGWNWTSALEAGIRLIQFTWIDALLSPSLSGSPGAAQLGTPERLQALRDAILPPHLWFVRRHQSFGSSANNHLLGELAGCVLATVRWPAAAQLAAPLTELQADWEREVLVQFSSDGGNREQALNYHLFSLEFCQYTLMALEAAGRPVSGPARERIGLAAGFYREVQVKSDPWDYGDSDSAFVLPLFSGDSRMEWRSWLEQPATSPSISYWLGGSAVQRPRITSPAEGEWQLYSETGIAVCRQGPWWLRWDVSPLGFLSTAAHGHVDALHLSLWVAGVALVIDPGTGAYFSDDALRAWLSSRAAHNAPAPAGQKKPRRAGPFLWTEHHPRPEFRKSGHHAEAQLDLWGLRITRRVSLLEGGRGVQVEDASFRSDGRPGAFTVRWQFPPGTRVTERTKGIFSVGRSGVSITVELDEHWSTATLGNSVVSSAFRRVCDAPFLELVAGPNTRQGAYFRTTFLDGESA